MCTENIIVIRSRLGDWKNVIPKQIYARILLGNTQSFVLQHQFFKYVLDDLIQGVKIAIKDDSHVQEIDILYTNESIFGIFFVLH